MLALTATDQTIELTTSSAADVDYSAHYADTTTTTFTPGSNQGTVASATTTAIVAAPGASTQRGIKHLSIRNRHASTAVTVTVKKDVAATEYELYKAPLSAGQSLCYEDGAGWQILDSSGQPLTTQSTGSPSGSAGGDLTGTYPNPTFSTSVVTAAAKTVLDDASVSAMVDTLGGASATGSGGLVRATSPTLVTPTLGVAAATTVNKVALTAPATAATLTIADGVTLTVNGNTTLTNGTHAGTNSGTNTGDQTITLTGDVTGSGTGSFAATVANDAVTYAKLQNVSATDKVLGRSTSGAGDVEEIACTAAARSILDDASVDAIIDTLGGAAATGTGALVRKSTPTLTTPVLGVATATTINKVALTAPATAATLTIADGATLTVSASATVSSGTHSGTNTGDQTITLTGDVTGSGTGSFAATIASDAVTYAKMQNVSATDKLLGRSTAGSGDVEEIACTAAARTVLDDATVSAMVDTLGGTAAQGSGAIVRATSPTLTTPVLGVATATSINKVALTAPASAATLTIANNQTLTVNGSATITNGTHSGTNTGDQSIFDTNQCTPVNGGTKSLPGWVAGGMMNPGQCFGGLVTKNQQYLLPFIVNRSGAVIDRIAVSCTTAQTGGVCKLGLFESVSASDPYPGAIVITEQATSSDLSTTGMKSVTVNQALTQGKLYHLGATFNATTTAPSIYWWYVTGLAPVYGYDSTGLNSQYYVIFALTYATAWSSPFNTGGTLQTSAALYTPVIFVRFSA